MLLNIIHLWFAIPFGLALAGPAWWLTIEVRGFGQRELRFGQTGQGG